MRFYFLNTGFNNGQYNMDYDIHLAQKCEPGEFYLRLYKWNPFCISLGANQKYEDINIKRIEDDKIDIVKRPTGGRAILHSEELTYSVVTSVKDQESAHKFYNEINKAIRQGLILYNSKLNKLKLESEQYDFRNLYKENKGNVCFAATAKSEIKFDDKKLVGSAQRKLGSNLLQHGSILCGDYHKKIIKYLNLPEEEIIEINNKINNVTIDLNLILNENINFKILEESIKKGFEKHYGKLFTETSIKINKKETTKVYQVL